MSGTLTLAATGIQDQWFTGDPQFSYFLVLYKRHTKFALEQIETPMSGTYDFGSHLNCIFPREKGDLLRNLTLKITMRDIEMPSIITTVPEQSTFEKLWNIPFTASFFHNLVEYAEIVIGGQVIERITGEYIYMYQQLQNTESDLLTAQMRMNAHGDFIEHVNNSDDALGDVYPTVGPSSLGYDTNGYYYTYYLELPFFFYKNPSLAIPMCALTKHSIEVNVQLRPFSRMVFGGVGGDMQALVQNIALDAEFVFLTQDEVDFLSSRPIEYAITQLQVSEFNMKQGETKKSVMLNFANPVKEMYFIVQNDAYVQYNNNLRYQPIKNIELRLNNQVAINAESTYLVYEQPIKHHINTPNQLPVRYRSQGYSVIVLDVSTEFGMYSFALQPEKYYPTGQVNMSRITHKLFTIQIDPTINYVYVPLVEKRIVSEASHGPHQVVIRSDIAQNSPGVRGYAESLDNKVRVYAVSYNILTIHSGLAGLKF